MEIIIENFNVSLDLILSNDYKICFTEKQFQENGYDFLYLKNYKITHLYNDLKKYNVIQKVNDGVLISNKYIYLYLSHPNLHQATILKYDY